MDVVGLFIQTVRYYHVTYAFQSESPLYSYQKFKELLARNKRNILSLSDSNEIRTHNHLVLKQTPNHLAKTANWLSFVVGTYLYNSFDSVIIM